MTYQWRILLCNLFYFILYATTIASGEGTNGMDPNQAGSTQSTLGTTQIYQPPPTTARSCYYYNSQTNVSRLCSLSSSCFAFIRRQTDGGFRMKRGCSSNCRNETRGRKIQVCCSSHLCNDHLLTPDNFTSTSAPPTQCYHSDTNERCNLTTACYSRLIYQSDGSFTHRQGCIRGQECQNLTNDRTIQQCCYTSLCNTRIPESAYHTPTYTQQTPSIISDTPPSSYTFRPPDINPSHSDDIAPPPVVTDNDLDLVSLSCHCSGNDCDESGVCSGHRCVTQIIHTFIRQFCVNDTSICEEIPSNGYVVVCCNSDMCNIGVPTTSQSVKTTQPTNSNDNHSTTTLSSPNPEPFSSSSSSSSSHQYFILATILSIVVGVTVICIMLIILIILILKNRKNASPKSAQVNRLPWQPSPDCQATACLSETGSKSSPSPSGSSSSTKSGDLSINTDLLKHMGTSV